MASTKERRHKPKVSRWRRPWIRSVVFGGAVLVLTLHLGACAAALLFLPRGFRLDELHAWTNAWLPLATGLVIIGALVRFVFFRSSALPISLTISAIAGGWIGGIVTGISVFPISFAPDRAVGPAAIALALATLGWSTRISVAPTVVAALVGGVLGVIEVLGQHAPPPSTRPLGGSPAEVHGEPSKEEASTGQVSFPCGKEHVRVRPLLTFESRSPDATWTVLAPADAFGPHRRLDQFAKEKTGFRAHYMDDGESTVVATKDAKGLDIEGTSRLSIPVYSHLNAFATIHVPFESTISFSPTGPEKFAVEPVDVPDAPRPITFAYLGADIVFHVVRASEGQTGPFTELAKGHLGREEPLTIEIRHKDGSSGSCRLTFKDWAAQVSTEASPTAGWGVPQNSIQFSSRGKEGFIVLTLAETGPGRGWQSVGHTEGTYRNRIRVDTVMDVPPLPPPPKR